MLGIPRDIVRLVPYTPEWVRLFDEERRQLQDAVGEHVLDIQHIGSTAIPGMIAKPLLDIAIAVADFEAARVCVEPIAALGYEYRGEGGIPRRHYFVKGEPRTHHVHMVEIGSQDWRQCLLFRDHLIRHPEAARQYAELKRLLAAEHRTDRAHYQAGKAAFVERILERASACADG